MSSSGNRWAWLILGAVVFAIAHTQAPLYWSNQNQYFLHGLAQGGLGHLNEDWLANTTDPTPVFSAGVAWIYRHLPERTFHLIYGVILGIYFISLMTLANALPFGPRSPVNQLRLAMALIVIHSALVRWLSVQAIGADYPWFLQAGLANQYVLGPGLQPSTFGTFLIAALAAFLNQRLVLTWLCLTVACVVHATYLLPAAMLTLGFLHVLWWEGRKRECLALGAATLLTVLPVVIDGLIRFGPVSIDEFVQAQRILVDFRLPHHARIDRWFDWIAAMQIIWMLIGIGLVRGTRILPVMLIAYMLAFLLTVVHFGNLTLALLFPWRMSVVLVPASTAVILAWLINFFHADASQPATLRRSPLAAGILTTIIAFVTAGSIAIQWIGLTYRLPEHEHGLFEFVRTHRRPGDLYLLPVRVPDRSLPPPRGAPSTTFVPPGSSLDLQRFRLATGVPIYVDYKSIPYKDVEVLEWKRRIDGGVGPVTHVVAPVEPANLQQNFYSGMHLEQFRLVYSDDHFKVYRVD